MIYRHDIKKINNEEILYIYIDNNYEFAKEFSSKKNRNQKLSKKIQKYIKKNKIAFNGFKVFFVINGIIVAGVVTNNFKQTETQINAAPYHSAIIQNIHDAKEVTKPEEEENINIVEEQSITSNPKQNSSSKETNISKNKPQVNKEEPKTETNKESNTNSNIPNEQMVTVHRSNGSVITLSMTDYLIGVVGAEMPASFSVEALKAQAVVARTYAQKLIKEGRKLTDTVSTQAYYDNAKLKSNWGSSYNTYYNKVKNAVTSTEKEVALYNGSYIDAVYHSTSNGKTANSEDVWGNTTPYLRSVDSKWDTSATSYLRTVQKDFNVIVNTLGLNIESEAVITVLSRTSNNSVKEIQIGEKIYTGIEIRTLLGLRSTDFDIEVTDSGLSIVTRGFGHGVGMSQYGANGMAKEGYGYKDILKHYYTGIAIGKL